MRVGELVAVYSAVTCLLYPLRHFGEIAMAYSLSRPTAQGAARVPTLRRPAGGRISASGATPVRPPSYPAPQSSPRGRSSVLVTSTKPCFAATSRPSRTA